MTKRWLRAPTLVAPALLSVLILPVPSAAGPAAACSFDRAAGAAVVTVSAPVQVVTLSAEGGAVRLDGVKCSSSAITRRVALTDVSGGNTSVVLNLSRVLTRGVGFAVDLGSGSTDSLEIRGARHVTLGRAGVNLDSWRSDSVDLVSSGVDHWTVDAGGSGAVVSAGGGAGTGPALLPGVTLNGDCTHADLLIGGVGDDKIYGCGGDDELWGGGGDDYLDGGANDDFLIGGADNDTEVGGGYNDIFSMNPPTNFTPGDVPVSIPDVGTASSLINIPSASSPIYDLNVRVYVNHPRTQDLTLRLISPWGYRFLLAQKRGNGTPYNGTAFDSEATTNIKYATNPTNDPFEGRFHPEWSLEYFDGRPATGTWKLEVTDDTSGSTGTIANWTLQITFANSSSDGNDVIKGQSGNRDVADYSGRSQPITATLEGGANDGQLAESDDLGVGADDVEDLYGGLGNDNLTGTDIANNDIRGGPGNDTVSGLGTYDLLYGGAGDDKLYGGLGDDTLYGNVGNDTVDGGAGTDWIKFVAVSSTTGLNVNLNAGSATGEGTDALTSIENVNGSGYNDTITGNSSANRLVGNAGNDTLDGRDGIGSNDTVDGGGGTDSCQADPGDTVLNCP